VRDRRSRLLLGGGTLASIGFLIVMALSGGPRESGQLVGPSGTGLMATAPEEVDRVDIESETRRLVLVRAGGRWRSQERDVPQPVAERLRMSLRFMHVAEPVRVLARDEWEAARARDFGLDPPHYSVVLSQGGRPLLAARFGAPNPQAVLQYARVDGRDVLYLMPRFVGREWEAVMDAVSGK
jgi:hypothetical protein